MTKEEAREVLGDVSAYLASRASLENEMLAGHTFTDICNAIMILKQQPCEDAISRKDIIDALSEYMDAFYSEDGRLLYSDHIITSADCDDLREWINSFPSVTPQQTRWIPVSERLPEEAGVYLVSMNRLGYPQREVDGFACGRWERFGNDVIAWCKILEPYKAESEGGE